MHTWAIYIWGHTGMYTGLHTGLALVVHQVDTGRYMGMSRASTGMCMGMSRASTGMHTGLAHRYVHGATHSAGTGFYTKLAHSTVITTPPIQRRNPNNSAEQFGGPIFRRNASQSPGLWPWPPQKHCPFGCYVVRDIWKPLLAEKKLHPAGCIRRKLASAKRK